MKNYLLTLMTLAIMFSSSCGPSSEEQTKQQYKENITSVLKIDANLDLLTKHDATKQAKAMRNLDLSKCPPDFSAAYVDHIHAWEDAATIERALKQLSSDENINDLLGQEALNEILGTNESPILNAIELESRLTDKRKMVSEYILSTYREVERIAVTYGATLPN